MKKILLSITKKQFSLIDSVWMGIYGCIPALAGYDIIGFILWLFPGALIMNIIMTYIQDKIVTFCNS